MFIAENANKYGNVIYVEDYKKLLRLLNCLITILVDLSIGLKNPRYQVKLRK